VNTLLLALAIYCSMGSMVYARAFQQMNVIGKHYKAVVPTSFAMSALEVLSHTLVLGETIINGFTPTALLYWFAMGAGGSTGCILAMYSHGKIGDWMNIVLEWMGIRR